MADQKRNNDTLKQMNKDFNNIKKFTFAIKMKLLEDNYDLLINADKFRKENRTGNQEICRMTGSIS